MVFIYMCAKPACSASHKQTFNMEVPDSRAADLRACLLMQYGQEAQFPVRVREVLVEGVTSPPVLEDGFSDGRLEVHPAADTVDAEAAAFARMGATLHKHNHTVYCDGNDSVWFSRDEEHRALMTMVGWPSQTLAYVLRALHRAMKADALFVGTGSGSSVHHVNMEAVREMVACARWAAVMWILQHGVPVPASEAAPSDGSMVTMREFMHRMVSAWVEVEVAPSVAEAVEDAPAVAVAVSVAAVAEAEVEVEAAVAVEDAPVLSKAARKPGGSNKRNYEDNSTSRKKPRNEKEKVSPGEGLFGGHLLAAKPTKG
jgi:hypothetical protein